MDLTSTLGLGTAAIVAYVLGALITAGFISGVRDEMDGIADLATIVCWPAALVIFLLIKASYACYAIGQLARRKG